MLMIPQPFSDNSGESKKWVLKPKSPPSLIACLLKLNKGLTL